VVAHVNAAQPDMLLNTGDIALNGENVPDDLAFAAEQHSRLTVPVQAIPGNHDIGDNPSPNSHGAGISDLRREIYRSHFGAEQWTMEAGDWFFIALNEAVEKSDFFPPVFASAALRASWRPARKSGQLFRIV
jgi:hypothetical protein